MHWPQGICLGYCIALNSAHKILPFRCLCSRYMATRSLTCSMSEIRSWRDKMQSNGYFSRTSSYFPLKKNNKKIFLKVCVIGLSEHVVEDVEELLGLIDKGQLMRRTSPTAVHQDSSRGHAVLQVRYCCGEKA